MAKEKPLVTLNLPNKYRPNTFSEVVGQTATIKLLESHIKKGNLPPCLIFYGPPGTGKTTTARLVAKALNPSDHGMFEKDSAEDGGKDNIKNTLLDIRNLPFEGNRKTIIFDEAHEITRQAFASLLKPTEEPPAHITFIFVTSNLDKIPLNIKSRSQIYAFSRLPLELIKEQVVDVSKKEKQSLPDELVDLVVDYSNGSMRNALVALETVITTFLAGETPNNISTLLGVLGSKTLSDFVLAFLSKDFKKLYKLSLLFNEERCDIGRNLYFLQQLLMDCRLAFMVPDLAVPKSELSYILPFIKSKTDALEPKSKTETLRTIGRKLDTMYDLSVDTESDIRRTSNKEAAISRFVIKLAQAFKDDN